MLKSSPETKQRKGVGYTAPYNSRYTLASSCPTPAAALTFPQGHVCSSTVPEDWWSGARPDCCSMFSNLWSRCHNCVAVTASTSFLRIGSRILSLQTVSGITLVFNNEPFLMSKERERGCVVTSMVCTVHACHLQCQSVEP